VLTVFNGLLHEKANKIFNGDKLSTVSWIVNASVLLNVTAKSKRGNEHVAYFRKLCTYIGCSKTSKVATNLAAERMVWSSNLLNQHSQCCTVSAC